MGKLFTNINGKIEEKSYFTILENNDIHQHQIHTS
jgi:hypothetical protein